MHADVSLAQHLTPIFHRLLLSSGPKKKTLDETIKPKTNQQRHLHNMLYLNIIQQLFNRTFTMSVLISKR